MPAMEEFHALVSTIDYPMFIVTAASKQARSGCLVGFVTQASIDPPRVAVLISKINHTYPVAMGSDELVVHFLGRHDRDLASLFGEATGDQIDKFAACEWDQTARGTPVLRGTRGWVAGPVLERLDAGDHVLHLVGVDSARLQREDDQLGFQAVRELHPGHPA
jgi:flavin reductase (DIM6/NTAB) family NADH-FMN oxidoreductase RutF